MRPAAHHTALAAAIRSLASEKSPGCLLDAQGTFLFVNEAWERHAAENGGGPGCFGEALIGTRWLDHIHGDEVRQRYAALLQRALDASVPRPRTVTQVSECNTPSIAALLSTRLDAVLEGGEAVGVRVVHALVRERPIGEVYEVVYRPLAAYRDAEGRLTQCSCCRRLRDPGAPEQWDLVLEGLARPAPAAQALCGYCAELHVGGGAA
ncbi:PAS domain-containing protein [Anaeromyxobacter diazotrophicus]|uniref:PAS domain-containing protein n=1 Tax=Anaeromyxobacter diazotrophicus TaxID=2590199 RepID=A0A7I9VRE0_9BACT|nr:PAS domain-containing protein [Anaeromyxobacter diazotrophicus]GEJ58808.1 hypothetical protein AMYX_35490 [Anaeromyxobacter diazotrophicus]